MTSIIDNIDNRTVSQKEWDNIKKDFSKLNNDVIENLKNVMNRIEIRRTTTIQNESGIFNIDRVQFENDADVNFKNRGISGEVESRTIMPGDNAATIIYKQKKDKEFQCAHEEALLENNRINLAKKQYEEKMRLAKEEIEEEIRYKHRQREDNDQTSRDLETIVFGKTLFEIAKAEYIR